MLEAQLHGKLTREQENLEDILTSNVFGSIKYVPFKKGLLPILRNTENDKGEYSLNDFKDIKDVTYKFWNWIPKNNSEGCEPDVLITITHSSGNKTIILVESKYLSGKSSEAMEKYGPNDQLAREWKNLLLHTEKDTQKVTLILLYVTANICYPQSEINESRQDFIKWLPNQNEPNIIWISWRKLTKLFFNSKIPILADVTKVLLKQGLKFYDGVSKCDFKEIHWQFLPDPIYLSWSTTNFTVKWRFVK